MCMYVRVRVHVYVRVRVQCVCVYSACAVRVMGVCVWWACDVRVMCTQCVSTCGGSPPHTRLAAPPRRTQRTSGLLATCGACVVWYTQCARAVCTCTRGARAVGMRWTSGACAVHVRCAGERCARSGRARCERCACGGRAVGCAVRMRRGGAPGGGRGARAWRARCAGRISWRSRSRAAGWPPG